MLRLIREQRTVTPAEAISPALIVLRDSLPKKLRQGAEAPNQRLEEVLSEQFRVQVIPVNLGLKNRELANAEDVKNLLQELREQMTAKLKDNSRIRLL